MAYGKAFLRFGSSPKPRHLSIRSIFAHLAAMMPY
jgi:hypothetical protein